MGFLTRAGAGALLLLACMTAAAQTTTETPPKEGPDSVVAADRFESTREMRRELQLFGELPLPEAPELLNADPERQRGTLRMLALNERIESIRLERGPRDPSLPPLLIEMADAAVPLWWFRFVEDNYAEAVNIAGWDAVASMPAVPPFLMRWCKNAAPLSNPDQLSTCGSELIKVRRSTRGPDHIDTAVDELEIGLLYRKQGMVAEAAPLLEHAAPIILRELPRDHPMRPFALREQGILAEARGDNEAALASHREAAGLWDTSAAQGHRELARLYARIGNAARALGRHDEAKAAYRRCRDDMLVHASYDQVQLSICWFGVSLSQQNQGRLDDAVLTFKAHLAWAEDASSLTGATCKQLLEGYAGVLREVGQGEQADAMDARAAAFTDARARVDGCGEDRPSTRKLLHNTKGFSD